MGIKCTVAEGYDKDSGLKLHRVMRGASIMAECYGMDSEKNAKKFAACDDMLDALTEFVQVMNSLPGSDDCSLAVWDAYHTARSAILKAGFNA